MSGEDNHEWFDNPELIGQSIALAGTVAEWWYSYQFTSNKDGTIFAVSDPGGNVNVKIYEYNASSNCGQGGYEQKGSTISNPNQYVKFGTNIKFNDEGTILFVSAPGDNYNYNAEIYVYEWNPSSNCGQGGWDQKGEKITGSHYEEGAALICNKEGTIIVPSPFISIKLPNPSLKLPVPIFPPFCSHPPCPQLELGFHSCTKTFSSVPLPPYPVL